MKILIAQFTAALLSTLQLSSAFPPLAGVTAKLVKTSQYVDLDEFVSTPSSKGQKTMLVLATYAADFNAIEYAQRLRYYIPELQKRGISKIGFVLNCESDSAKALVDLVDLPSDVTEGHGVTLMVDPLGRCGRAFGVGTGWRPDDAEMSPYVKLFGMLFGLGAWATLPAVIGGYIGNPFKKQPWIEDALAVGQRKGRWPDMALVLDEDSEKVITNKFKELPVVGGWSRRPLELATLRLQNMMDISIKNWKELAPNEKALNAGVLTQLGGCIVCDDRGNSIYEWRDPGICAVANFEDILAKIPKSA
eukprot:CAMPEP_0172301486 /NCGR_PEP_ID=MMETSP1058-20130122/3373_1 /TAXON_ID=83371 /ORGANISM="Detonula confervacea, Strain CCMP 353" /LENGTH=304 /DNA_ID=CAMNT_0013011625 /DNA_START=25 /DNA_END=939 /DNA_ORIENTATION=+